MQVMARGLEEARKIGRRIGQGRLRVGTLYSLTLETVPRLIMGMKLRRPDLEMDLTMGSNETLLRMLDDGSLDAILISISESDIDRNSLEVLTPVP
jgi:LysR family malonate utilization transcriptional regulator